MPDCSHRSQTQSQYLNFGDANAEGKAEAEASHQGSRAFVGKCQMHSPYGGI